MLYRVLAVALVVVTAAIVGAACALLAERYQMERRRWFVLGAVAGLFSGLVGGWLQWAAIGAPIATLLLARPDSDPESQPIWRRSQASVWWVKLGLLLFASLIVYAPVAGGMESLRRSATADATIIDSYPTILSGEIGRASCRERV
jgi:hypothetical protein